MPCNPARKISEVLDLIAPQRRQVDRLVAAVGDIADDGQPLSDEIDPLQEGGAEGRDPWAEPIAVIPPTDGEVVPVAQGAKQTKRAAPRPTGDLADIVEGEVVTRLREEFEQVETLCSRLDGRSALCGGVHISELQTGE